MSLAVRPQLPRNLAVVRRKRACKFLSVVIRESLRGTSSDRHSVNVGVAGEIAVVDEPFAVGRGMHNLDDLIARGQLSCRGNSDRRIRRNLYRPQVLFADGHRVGDSIGCEADRFGVQANTRERARCASIAPNGYAVYLSRYAVAIGKKPENFSVSGPRRTAVLLLAIGQRNRGSPSSGEEYAMPLGALFPKSVPGVNAIQLPETHAIHNASGDQTHECSWLPVPT